MPQKLEPLYRHIWLLNSSKLSIASGDVGNRPRVDVFDRGQSAFLPSITTKNDDDDVVVDETTDTEQRENNIPRFSLPTLSPN